MAVLHRFYCILTFTFDSKAVPGIQRLPYHQHPSLKKLGKFKFEPADLSFEKKISVESMQNKNYKLLHAYVQCVYIVSAMFQIAPSKAVVGVDRPMKALPMHIQKP